MKITRIIVLILVMCFLVGCSQPAEVKPQEEKIENPTETVQESEDTPQEPVEQFVFTRENFPRMDGSTSTVPLGEAIASVLLGETREEVSDLIQFNKTTESYRNLMRGDADILIAAEPAEVIWEEKKDDGFKWEMEPFAVDGLVFIVNENNPIDSLTIEEIQAIYSGQITYWSQVGGYDIEIVPFQRNAEAGSQTAMLKHVMKDVPLMEAPKEYIFQSMFGLLEGIATYNGSAASIGYTMYYYAEDMKMAEGLKILKIDGVEPNDETIRSGEYPFLNNYYALTKSDLPKDDPARVMYEWLLDEGGQRLVANEGYVSAMDVGDNSGPVPWDVVKTDWSKLRSYENEPLFTYFNSYSKDGLLHPYQNYGLLLPYEGSIIGKRYDTITNYGLVTPDGQIVTEPIYSGIYYTGEFLILYQNEYMQREYPDSEYVYEYTISKYTIAAKDGRWIKDLGQIKRTFLLEKDVLAITETDGSMIVIDADGNILSEFQVSIFLDHFGEDYLRYYYNIVNADGYLCICSDYEDPAANALILDVYNGTIVNDYPKNKISIPDYSYKNPPEIPGYDDVYTCTDSLTGKKYYRGRCNTDEENVYTYDLLDENYQVIFKDFNVNSIYGGYASTIEDDYFCYYSLETGEPIFRFPIRSDMD